MPVEGEGYAVPGTGQASVRWHCTNLAKVNGSTCPLDFTGVDVFTTSHNGTKITSMHGYFDPALPTAALAPCLHPTHYGDPFRTPCLKDEKVVQVIGGYEICAPPCPSGAGCPSDQPLGSVAKPECALSDPASGDHFCALMCDPKAANPCGPKESCKSVTAINGPAALMGICSYDDGPGGSRRSEVTSKRVATVLT